MENQSAPDSHLLILIEKYVNNTLSKEELGQLLDLAKENSDELFNALKLQWNKAKETVPQNDEKWDQLFNNMMENARQTKSASSSQSIEARAKVYNINPGRKRMLIRIAAVAAIVVLVFTAAFFLLRQDNKEFASNPPMTRPNDIGPGSDKAILTLADGRKIVLDTASNGALAQQGGISVIKIGGQLSYNSSGKSSEVFFNTITTPRGGQYQLELSDGSKVWLNAASSLRFPTSFNGKDRIVELSGEGYFEVAHNAKMPFHVKVNDMEVTVLGTHFNINSYDDEHVVKTTLLEGRISVAKSKKYVYLNPGQQASIAEGESSIRVINDVNVDEVIAWKNGLIQFSGADLGKVMRNIGRWYDVEVSYTNVESAHLSGKVSRQLNLNQVIKVLEESGIEVKTEGRKIIATPKP